MSRLKWFLAGVLTLAIATLIAGAIFVKQSRGWSAREKPSVVEQWAARMARQIAVPADAAAKTNPIAYTPEILIEARAHWADHCASCHANDGSGETSLGQHLYPPAPDMRLPATQRLTDGELMFIIENGVRLTGMPSWGRDGHTQDDSWKLVHFIRHLPDVTFEEKKGMEKMNPKSPDELREEENEERFLRGEQPNESQPETHHHHH